MKLRGHSPNSYIHASVSDLFIPTIGLPILMQENRWTDHGNLYITPFPSYKAQIQHVLSRKL
jgi:hypothetical protein